MTTLSIVCLAGVGLAACSTVTTLGKLTGGFIGTRAASLFSVPTKVVVDPRGGKFCDVLPALGWPPQITDDKLNRPLANAVVGTLEFGEKQCGWKS